MCERIRWENFCWLSPLWHIILYILLTFIAVVIIKWWWWWWQSKIHLKKNKNNIGPFFVRRTKQKTENNDRIFWEFIYSFIFFSILTLPESIEQNRVTFHYMINETMGAKGNLKFCRLHDVPSIDGNWWYLLSIFWINFFVLFHIWYITRK